MGVVAEVERRLAELRCAQADDQPEVRTSTMTHVVWAPPAWLRRARAVFEHLDERHPARTIFLVPEPGRPDGVRATVSLRESEVHGLSREVTSEVVELRLGGRAARHPGSVVLPLLLSDLPAFCRWRGEPPWGTSQLEEVVGVCDRLVVDSGEWRGLPGRYERLCALFERIAVSDVAFSRSAGWRVRLAERWPGIRSIARLRVEGPRADALLLAGWLRSRLRRDVALTRRSADAIRAVWVDGDPVAVPFGLAPAASDLLSGELDVHVRDPVFEAAALAAAR